MVVSKSLINQKDLDCAVDCFEKVVKNVLKNGDGVQQAKLLTKLKDLTKLMLTRKDSASIETLEVPQSKKIKLNPIRNIEIPNEIWLKIMNYLPTRDIFGTFALLNKRLNGMTTDSKSLKYLSLNHQLDKWYFNNHCDQAMQVLDRSTGLVGISIQAGDNWNKIINTILDSNIASLRSLEVSIPTDDGYFCDSYHCDYYHGTRFPIELIQALNVSKIKLNTLKLKGFIIEPEVMIEISKMESLKTLSILDTKQKVLSHEVILALAMNANQLESIEIVDKEKTKYDTVDDGDEHFDDVSSGFSLEQCENEYKIALNTLFERKQSSLKCIKIFNLGDSGCRIYEPCLPLTNLGLCQNLEEFCGNLHDHDLKILSTLPNLIKLKFNNIVSIEDFQYFLSNVNLSKLKYLSLYASGLKSVCEELKSYNFTALERLCISAVSISKESVQQLMKNCPNLKSIQFPGGYYCYELPKEFSYNLFKDQDIFIIFDKVRQKDDQINTDQKSFEEYIIEQDLQEFKRYKRMKEDFSRWCENNPRYGY